MSKTEIAKKTSTTMVKIVFYIVLYVVIAAVVQWLFTSFLLQYGINIADYMAYVQILLAIAFGYLIVSGVVTFFYWSMRTKYDHSTAAAIRNIVKIIGIVIGFASQQVLGQAVSGLFLLTSRPFRIGDVVSLAGEDGIVDDVATLFTIVIKADGTKVLIPNNSIIGNKIYLKPKS
ncbi:MAG: mechanosensitive ion channel [Nitrososphaerota archaeon]